MSRWFAVISVVALLTVLTPAPATASDSIEEDEPRRAAATEPPGRPDDPPRRREPPARPSTVLERQQAQTSVDRSLAAGIQAAPIDNRVVGSVIAAGGTDVVRGATLASLASVTDRSTSRNGGVDRYDTAIAFSAEHFPTGVNEVWLATGEAFPDGLAAAPIAGARGGPVLLTRQSALPAGVAAELSRLAPQTIWIVGGTAAITDVVMQQVLAAVPGAAVTRVAGSDRYGTAASLAQQFFPSAPAAFIATGFNFPDALGAGPAAVAEQAPTLLVSTTSIPSATETQLQRLHPRVAYIIGGPDVVSEAVMARIAQLTGGEVMRISGADRYATVAAVADRFFQATTRTIVLATGLNFPDALSAGAVAGLLASPILLVNAFDAPPRVTSDAARRLSWWLPDSGRVLRYTVSTHPDDEMAAWSLSGEPDPRRYDVLIVLTTGEATAHCNGLPVDHPWVSEQFIPQPQPTGVQYSERCKQHRMDSWNVFLDRAEVGQVGAYESLTGGPITFGGREIPVPLSRDEAGNIVSADQFEVAVGPDSARISFDMGALSTDEVLWAIQTARGLSERFPTDVEGDIIGAGFYNDAGTGYGNLHEDHRALYQLLGSVDLGMPGSQYMTVGHDQTARAFGATVAPYCTMMCHPAAPTDFRAGMGQFQFAYGWLADGYWPPGAVDAYAGFSRYQSFAKWF